MTHVIGFLRVLRVNGVPFPLLHIETAEKDEKISGGLKVPGIVGNVSKSGDSGALTP